MAAAIYEREGVMNDGVWKEMRDEESGQKENGQEKIAKDTYGGCSYPPLLLR